MLRIHFLNVGHGDCTIISHPSRRLTMIDINNSQDYDDESFQELLKEERQKADAYSGLAAHSRTNALQASGLLGASFNRLLAPPPIPLVTPRYGLSDAMRAWPVLAEYILPNVYADAVQDSKKELTDPIEFLERNYPEQSLFRFILTHPDLDHMRGLKRLHESIGFTNFWDTAHTKPTPNTVASPTGRIGSFTRRYGAPAPRTTREATATLPLGRMKMVSLEATTSKSCHRRPLW